MSQTFQLGNTGNNFAAGDLDIVFDSVGRLVVLEDQNKLIQDVEKILFTDQNYFYPQYSTKLEEVIGTTPNIDALKLSLAQRVTDSLIYLQALQTAQKLYQPVTAGEVLATINSVGVTYEGDIITSNPAALTTFDIATNISNALRQSIIVARSVSGN